MGPVETEKRVCFPRQKCMAPLFCRVGQPIAYSPRSPVSNCATEKGTGLCASMPLLHPSLPTLSPSPSPPPPPQPFPLSRVTETENEASRKTRTNNPPSDTEKGAWQKEVRPLRSLVLCAQFSRSAPRSFAQNSMWRSLSPRCFKVCERRRRRLVFHFARTEESNSEDGENGRRRRRRRKTSSKGKREKKDLAMIL